MSGGLRDWGIGAAAWGASQLAAVTSVGTGSESTSWTFRKPEAGTTTLLFQVGSGAVATGAKRIVHETDETLHFGHYDGAAWSGTVWTGTVLRPSAQDGQSLGQLSFRWSAIHGKDVSIYNTLSFPVGSPSLTLGDGTGAPNWVVNKSATGVADFDYKDTGVIRWTFRFTASEDIEYRRHNTAGVFQDTPLRIYASNGNVEIGQACQMLSSLRVDGSIGFFGAAVAAKPTVSGSRGANAALASLLTGLAGLGLLTDSSTA